LTAIEAALDQEGAFQELQRDYSESLQTIAALRHRVTELQREFAELAASAAPFVTFVQDRYNILHHRLAESERVAHDRRRALEERLDNAQEVQDMRARLRYERGVHLDAVAAFQTQITDLERELTRARAHAQRASAAASSTGGSDRDVQRLRSELNTVSAALLVARREANGASDDVRALETSQKALEASSHIVRQQIVLLERRNTDLRQRLAKQKISSERVLDRSLQERDRLQGLLDKSDTEMQGRMAELQRVSAQRDHYRDESTRIRTYVCSHIQPVWLTNRHVHPLLSRGSSHCCAGCHRSTREKS
jgi:chromosome segregation ATPase